VSPLGTGRAVSELSRHERHRATQVGKTKLLCASVAVSALQILLRNTSSFGKKRRTSVLPREASSVCPSGKSTL